METLYPAMFSYSGRDVILDIGAGLSRIEQDFHDFARYEQDFHDLKQDFHDYTRFRKIIDSDKSNISWRAKTVWCLRALILVNRDNLVNPARI